MQIDKLKGDIQFVNKNSIISDVAAIKGQENIRVREIKSWKYG